MLVLLQTLEGWVYMDPIHGPLDGPLYMGSIYSNTKHEQKVSLIIQFFFFWQLVKVFIIRGYLLTLCANEGLKPL